MRFPVFARGVNPSVEKPILHKSKSYAFSQVECGRADWVDPLDHSRGIIAREMIYFGPKELAPEQPSSISPGIFGLKFIPPKMEKNPTLTRLEYASLVDSAPSWDWTHEPQTISA